MQWISYWWKLREARKAGRSDGEDDGLSGRVPWPQLKDNDGNLAFYEDGKPKIHFNDYEMRVANGYTNSIDHIARPWEDRDRKLLARLRTLRDEKGATEERIKETDGECQRLRPELEELEKQKATFVPPIVQPGLMYWPFLVLLALVEIPLNAIAFRPFGESEVLNYVFALAVGGGLVTFAHFCGLKAKEGKMATAATCAVVPLAALFAVAYVRKEYMAHGDVFMSANTALWVFWVIGALLFGVGVIVSYLQHEGRAEARTVLENLKDKRRALQPHERQLARLRKRLASREKAFHDTEGRRIGLLRSTHRAIRPYRNSARDILAEYRRRYVKAYVRAARESGREGVTLETPNTWPFVGTGKAAVEEGDPEMLEKV